MRLLVIIVSIFFFVVFAFIVFGVVTKPKLKRLVINPGQGNFNKNCYTEKVSCHTDQDCSNLCSEAQEGEEVICQAIPDVEGLTAEQRQILGANGPNCNGTHEQNASNPECQTDNIKPNKYCIPAKAKTSLKNCNQKHGGIPVFSGWGGAVDHMEFDCLCTYPLWASSRICDSETGGCEGQCLLNPGICEGGTFNWDLTKKAQPPIAQLCECKDGDILVVSNEGLPRCVPEHLQSWYTDLDIDTGIQGGQQRVNVRGIPITPLNKALTCVSLCPYAHADNCPNNDTCKLNEQNACVSIPNNYTTCPNGCCTAGPDAVCCGDFCCPKGYTCDINNSRCIREKCCDDGKSGNGSGSDCKGDTCCPTDTPCGDGCCPGKDMVCCGDSCCPPGYICDPSGKGCNPVGIELCKQNDTRKECMGVKDNKCIVGNNNTNCGKGCCPLPDANCCGDYCCPAEYPVCDYENKACSMEAPSNQN